MLLLLVLASCGCPAPICDATNVTQTVCMNTIPYTCWQKEDGSFVWYENAALTGECK